MIYSSEDMQTRAVLDTAARMCAAARTAPKTRGMDGLVTCVVTGEDKDRLAAHMRELAGRLDYAFFARDVGIAIGSAAAAAADARVDSRVMFSVGRAARSLGLLGASVTLVLGIPLSVSGKSPFFDRKPKK